MTPAKRKKIEEKMTLAETSSSPIYSAPGDKSQLFRDAIQTPTKNMISSFSAVLQLRACKSMLTCFKLDEDDSIADSQLE